jgi:hypothetical protein
LCERRKLLIDLINRFSGSKLVQPASNMADTNGSTTPKELGKGGDMSSSLKSNLT